MNHDLHGGGAADDWHPQDDGNQEAEDLQWTYVDDPGDPAHWQDSYNSASCSRVSADSSQAYLPETGTLGPYSIPLAQNSVSSGYSQTPQGYGSHANEVEPSQDHRQVFGPRQPVTQTTGSYGQYTHGIVGSTESYVHPPSFRHDYPLQHNNQPTAPLSMSYSPSTSQLSKHSPTPDTARNGAEYSVACPYRCGAVLTGVHAIGNLTRHLKTQACAASGRAKVRYPCPIEGCTKEYSRSDGLKVHMRKQHGAPTANAKNGSPLGGVTEDDDDE